MKLHVLYMLASALEREWSHTLSCFGHSASWEVLARIRFQHPRNLCLQVNHSALVNYVLSYPVFVTNVTKSVASIHNSYSKEVFWYVDSKADFCFQCFPYSRQSNTETHLKIGHDHFYPHRLYLCINVHTHTHTHTHSDRCGKVHVYESSSGSTTAGHARQKLGHLLSLFNTTDR